MSDHIAREEGALEADARRRTEDIRATEEAALQAAAAAGPSPDAEIDGARRSVRQHDDADTDTDTDRRSQLGGRPGARR